MALGGGGSGPPRGGYNGPPRGGDNGHLGNQNPRPSLHD
jgi:hypothetical protein